MHILADYHTHTKYSHGKGTIEENVLEAISKGIKTIGISDHGYKHLAYGIKLNDIYKMREEKDKLKIYEENISKAPNSRVKAGIAMSMIDYSIMHITSATLETITGDDDQFVDPAHNFALQDLTDIQTQLLASQSTDTDEDSVDSSEQASFAEETTK